MSYQKENEAYKTLGKVGLTLYDVMMDLGREHPEYVCIRNLLVEINSAECMFHKYLPHNQEPDQEEQEGLLIDGLQEEKLIVTGITTSH